MSLPTTPRERAGFRPCCDGRSWRVRRLRSRLGFILMAVILPDSHRPPVSPSLTGFGLSFRGRHRLMPSSAARRLPSPVEFGLTPTAYTAKFNVVSGPFPPFRARVRSLTLDVGPDEPLCITFGLKSQESMLFPSAVLPGPAGPVGFLRFRNHRLKAPLPVLISRLYGPGHPMPLVRFKDP